MNYIKAYLEELMDFKRAASIKFRSVEGGVLTVKGHIVKMDSVFNRDVIETDAGLTIEINQIIEINGRHFENIC